MKFEVLTLSMIKMKEDIKNNCEGVQLVTSGKRKALHIKVNNKDTRAKSIASFWSLSSRHLLAKSQQ